MVILFIVLILPSLTFGTYSIIAWDGEQMGVAVQSHWFSVGSIVTWAEAGVGVVATQSFANPIYGEAGLELLKKGFKAEEVLNALLSIDKEREVRQVAILDKNGNISVFTGKKCIKYYGHIKGKNFSVQANLMKNEGVPEAMAKAFEEKNGSLAEKMIEALKAAEEMGGDLRGRQSAAIKIVKVKKEEPEFKNILVDLRVEDHPEPLKEIERLYKMHKAYFFMDKGDEAVSKGDIKNALNFYQEAMKWYKNEEINFWAGLYFYLNGKKDEGKKILKELIFDGSPWKELLFRLVEQGMIEKKDINFILK